MNATARRRAIATACATSSLAACMAEPVAGDRFGEVKGRVAPRLSGALADAGLELGAPVFMRVFKEEAVLELWVRGGASGRYRLFRSYPICAYSGGLGPKLAEGDRQAPEGFYAVGREQMNPRSRFHLSFDLGFPNAYDRLHGRTGSFLMVHGACVSTGCYAMTDPLIEEIYTLADAALAAGQERFQVHCFPFRMSGERMREAVAEGGAWVDFWRGLEGGYLAFESARVPPRVDVAPGGNYRFIPGS